MPWRVPLTKVDGVEDGLDKYRLEGVWLPPFALLSYLMLSGLYPDVTLLLCIIFIVFISVTLVDYTRTPLKTH